MKKIKQKDRHHNSAVCVWMPHDMKHKIKFFLSNHDMQISEYIRKHFQHIIKTQGL